MTHTASLRIAAALSLSLACLSAMAQQPPDITFVGASSDKLHVEGRLFANTTQEAVLQETLADGTLHNRFHLTPNGQFGIQGGWSVKVGDRTIGSYEEGYEHGVEIGAWVDAYLKTDGQSALSLTWTLNPACHGGCWAEDKIQLDLTSTDGSLFANSIDAGTFQRYTSGSGFVSAWSQYGGGPDEPVTYHDEAHFTLSAVPEPRSWALALIGMGGIAAASARGRKAGRDGA